MVASSLVQGAKGLPGQQDRAVEMGIHLGQPQFWASDASHGGKGTGCWPTSGDLVRPSEAKPYQTHPGMVGKGHEDSNRARSD